MSNKSRIGMKALYCGAVATLFTPNVLRAAQDSPPDQGTQLETIVVTATRSETNLQQTPIAVTAMSGNMLANRNVASILDVSNFAPSLSIGSRSGTGSAGGSISIRGMGVDATASSAAVGVYVDDVYFSSDRGNLVGLLDVDRVEVLRGPQGTLFGRNTIAGAIQYVTRQPEKEFGGYATVTGGNYGRAEWQAAVNVPLGDTLAMRLVGATSLRGGYIHDNYTGEERGSDKTQIGRLKLRWTPTDRLTVDFKEEVLTERTNGRAVLIDKVNPNAQFVGLAGFTGETRPLNNSYLSSNKTSFPGFNAPDYFHFDFSVTELVINYRLSDNTNFKSITSYSTYRSRLAQDFDDTPLSILGSVPAHNDTRVFTEELQLSGKALSNQLKWTTGVYYYDSKNPQDPGQGIALGLAPPFAAYGNPESDVDSTAVYGQGTYNLTDSLSGTLGLRYSSETNKAWLIGVSSPVSSTVSNVSPHLGINYQLEKDVMAYVKASKGFRAGGITPNAALPGGALAFLPETAWTYEAGARMEFLGHRLRVNPTFFFTNWKNIQFNVLIPTPTTVVAATNNAGDATIKGFELESQFVATDRLTLNGALSLLSGHYTRVDNLTQAIFPLGFPAFLGGVPGSAAVVPTIALGTPLQRLPKSKFNVGAQYSYPLVSGARLVSNVNYAWTAEQESAVTILDSVRMPAYGVLNGRLQYDAAGRAWSVAVFGTNLTNKHYLIGGADFAGGYTVGERELDPARPREVGVELKIRF